MKILILLCLLLFPFRVLATVIDTEDWEDSTTNYEPCDGQDFETSGGNVWRATDQFKNGSRSLRIKRTAIGGNCYAVLTFSAGTEFYIGWWQRFENPQVYGTDGAKNMDIRNNSGNKHQVFYNPSHGSAGIPNGEPFLTTTVTDGFDEADANVPDGWDGNLARQNFTPRVDAYTLDTWQCMVLYVKMNSGNGTYDGTATAWLDGEKIAEYTPSGQGLPTDWYGAAGDPGTWNEIEFTGFHNGPQGPAGDDQDRWFDDIVVATTFAEVDCCAGGACAGGGSSPTWPNISQGSPSWPVVTQGSPTW